MWGVGQLSVNHVGQFCLDFIQLFDLLDLLHRIQFPLSHNAPYYTIFLFG